MRAKWALAAVAVIFAGSVTAQAQSRTFQLNMLGANEPNAAGQLGFGDPDGFATGTITLDPVADTVSWNFTYGNITGDALSGFHIHGPGATLTTNRPVFIPLEPLSTTALPSGTLSGTRTAAQTADIGTRIDQVLANPGEFYANLHSSGTTGFPSGAVRAQLPEPGTLSLLGVAALALLRRRRLSA